LRRSIVVSALAESDLVGIWEYSFEQWDAGQADDYLDELNAGIQLLADHPELGANRDYVREGYRVLFVNRHAIYYIVSPSGIRVVRVLHEQMDPGKHF
jgi:toxin ParE1/3/4